MVTQESVDKLSKITGDDKTTARHALDVLYRKLEDVTPEFASEIVHLYIKHVANAAYIVGGKEGLMFAESILTNMFSHYKIWGVTIDEKDMLNIIRYLQLYFVEAQFDLAKKKLAKKEGLNK